MRTGGALVSGVGAGVALAYIALNAALPAGGTGSIFFAWAALLLGVVVLVSTSISGEWEPMHAWLILGQGIGLTWVAWVSHPHVGVWPALLGGAAMGLAIATAYVVLRASVQPRRTGTQEA